MTLIIKDVDLDRPLTTIEEQQIRKFAESVLTKSRERATKTLSAENIDAICQIMSKLDSTRSAVELVHEATDYIAKKYAD